MARRPIPADTIARIVEARAEGLTADKVAELIGVSRGTVIKYSTSSPLVKPGRKPGVALGRQFYDDPRFDHPPENEYDDVVPIRFFPADLPRLIPDPFGWTPLELYLAVIHARKLSLLSRRTRRVRRSIQAPPDQHRTAH